MTLAAPSAAGAAPAHGKKCRGAAKVKAQIKRTQAQLSKAERSGRPTAAETKRRLERRIERLRRKHGCAPDSRLIVQYEPTGPSTESGGAADAGETRGSGQLNHAGGSGAQSPGREPSPGPQLPPEPDPPAEAESPVESESPAEPEPPSESEPLSEPEPPAGPEAPESEPPAPLSIAVAGNRLVDGSGKTLQLHGVNFSGTMWSCLYGKAFASPTDDAALASMVAWHINAVRIPMNEDCWLGINGAPTDVDSYHAAIKNFVDRLHALGMYAILDLHWSAPGTTLSHLGPGFEDFFEMADADHSPAFWESLASYFKDDHALLFDLYNEPFEISWSCLRDGCFAPREYQAAGMQQLVDAVRSTGATQPVLVAGPRWASLAGEEWLRNQPQDPAHQLAASIHAYGVMGNYGVNIGVVANQVPVVLTEVGEKDCAHDSLDRILPWADNNGVSYLAWAWYTGDCYKGPSLISDYSGTPTPYGIGYRDHLVSTFPAPSPGTTG